jgi:hypothetical protein
VPNAFTADQDGINDAWRPVLSNPELLDGYRLTVFNRWGERVFENEDPEAWWVGGSSAPDGAQGAYFVPNEVYSWRLVLDVREGVAFDCASGAPLFDVRKGGSDCTLTGQVTLIR